MTVSSCFIPPYTRLPHTRMRPFVWSTLTQSVKTGILRSYGFHASTQVGRWEYRGFMFADIHIKAAMKCQCNVYSAISSSLFGQKRFENCALVTEILWKTSNLQHMSKLCSLCADVFVLICHKHQAERKRFENALTPNTHPVYGCVYVPFVLQVRQR